MKKGHCDGVPDQSNFDSSGFTLIEVLAALALAGVMIAVMVISLQQSSLTQKQLAGRTTALILAQGKLAEIENGGEAALSGEFTEPYSAFKWYAGEESVAENLTAITLTVEWRDGRATLHQRVYKGFRQEQ